MSEEGYLATARARAQHHDPSARLLESSQRSAENEDAMNRELAVRNAGRPMPDPRGPAQQKIGAAMAAEMEPDPDEEERAQNLEVLGRRQERAARFTPDQLPLSQKLPLMGEAAGDMAVNAAQVPEQIGVGILKATGSTISGLAQITGLDEELTNLTTWVAETFNLPTLREAEGFTGQMTQDLSRYGTGFAMGGAIAKTAGFTWGMGRALFADGFSEFFAFDEDQENMADVVGMFKDWNPEFAAGVRETFVDAFAKNEDDTAVEARLNNMIANSGTGVGVDSLVFVFRAMKHLKDNPALLREAHRMGLRGVASAGVEAGAGVFRDAATSHKEAAQRLVGALGAMTEAAMRPGGSAALQRGQVGWHGSPHRLERFSREKIGTGEGAQVYGSGHYIADRRGIGEHYRDAVAQRHGRAASLGGDSGYDHPNADPYTVTSYGGGGENEDPVGYAILHLDRTHGFDEPVPEGKVREALLESAKTFGDDEDAAGVALALADDPIALEFLKKDYDLMVDTDSNVRASGVDDQLYRVHASYMAKKYGGDPQKVLDVDDGNLEELMWYNFAEDDAARLLADMQSDLGKFDEQSARRFLADVASAYDDPEAAAGVSALIRDDAAMKALSDSLQASHNALQKRTRELMKGGWDMDRALSVAQDDLVANGEIFGLSDEYRSASARALAATQDAVDSAARERKVGHYRDAGDIDDPGPYLYRVDVRDDAIEAMINWDAPLSKQPLAVQEALDSIKVALRRGAVEVRQNIHGDGKYYLVDDTGEWGTKGFDTEEEASSFLGTPIVAGESAIDTKMYGSDLVRRLESKLGPEGAADFLSESGIRGVKYDDAVSRGRRGQRTHNYVVFRDEDVQVLARNDREPIHPPPVGGQRLPKEEAHRTAAWLMRSNHPQMKNLKQRGDYIQRRSVEAMGGTSLPKDEKAWTPEHKSSVARLLASDVKTALEHPDNAASWYKAHVDAAHRVASVKYPELRSDQTARSRFNFALAITSQGDSVSGNTSSAMTAYEFKSRTGRWPENTQEMGSGGKAINVMLRSFRMYNRLESDLGPEMLETFLADRVTVGDLKRAGLKVSGELVDQELYGSSIFGPKIGGAFYSNLEGRTTELTMDKWWTRTWGRYTGNLMADPETQRRYANAFREAAQADPEWRRKHRITMRELRSLDGTLNAAARVQRGFATGKYADGSRAAKGFADKDVQLHKAARAIDQKVLVPSEQLNGTRRKVMREVAEEARDLLRAEDVDLDMADIQALVWYLEKDVYASLGQNVERITFDEALADYLVEKEGFDATTIANARSGRTSGAGAGNHPGGAGAGGADGGGSGVAGQELDREQILERVRAALTEEGEVQ